MASVHPRTSRDGETTSWRVMFRIGETQRQETFNGEGAEASAYEFKRLVETVGGAAAKRVLEARLNASDDMPTLRTWTARYLDPDSGLLTGIEPGTREGYRRAANRSYLNILGDYPVDAIGKADVGRWLAWQEKQPSTRHNGRMVAPKTIRNYHAILSAVLASAVQEKLRDGNPAYRTRLTRGIKHEGVFLSPDEFATILHFIPQRYEGLFMFLAGTGTRWGEATAVTWGNVNLTSRTPTVRIERAWKKGPTGAPILKQPKTPMSRRTISLTPDVVAALGTPGPSGTLLFPGPLSGNHLWYNKVRVWAWNPAVKKAQDPELCEQYGLTVLTKTPTIHDLRHSHASWLIADGVPLPMIQARLGHESITTTIGTYGHLAPDTQDLLAEVVQRTLTGVRPMRQLA